MGLIVRYVQQEPKTGRLIYRRAFPEALRPYLENSRRELKVPLGAKSPTAAIAARKYREATQQYDREIAKARAVQRLEGQKQAGRYDHLSEELIDFLVLSWNAEDLALDEEVRWTPRPGPRKREAQRTLREHSTNDLEEALSLRALGDIDTIMAQWGESAEFHAALQGFHLDKTAPEFVAYVRAFHDIQIEGWRSILRRLDGEIVPAPPRPLPPSRGELKAAAKSTETFEEITEGLMESPRKPMSATTKEAVRTGLRFFREVHGTPTPDEITRRMVADWLDLLAQRPSKLSKNEAGLPLPEVISRYADRPEVPRLTPKTLIQHLSMLSARWTQAAKSGRVNREAPNPFKDQDMERPTRRRAPRGFNSDELRAIFGLPIFTAGERPLGGKGEASYWLPLLLLFTGARPEEIAQLLVTDIYKDAPSGRWLLSITNEGAHPHKPVRTLKTDERGAGPRTFPLPQPLLDLGLLAYVATLQKAGEVALFPRLRTKGARGMLYAGLGEWWGKYLKASGAFPEGQDRQPMRELRHTWSTAARKAEVPREVMAYIQGHSLPDATSGDDYGDRSPLGLAMNALTFEGVEMARIQPWEARTASK